MSDDRSLDRALERLLAEDRLDRRTFATRAGGVGLALGGASFLAACGGVEGSGDKKPEKKAANHGTQLAGQLNFSNWPLYIDEKHTTLKDFTKETGTKVNYKEEINDNEEFFGKVREQLARGKDIKRDIVVLTDWMAAKWIRLGYVEPIDKSNVPNAKNLLPTLQHPSFDPDRTHTLPWQTGQTGIGYDRSKTGRDLNSMEDLFDPEFKGKVGFLTEMRDSVGLVMLLQGSDPSNFKGTKAAEEAIAKLQEANDSGQIRQFLGNNYSQGLAKGDIIAAAAWSGDVVQLQADNPDLKFVIPKEGGMLWADNMMLPVNRPKTSYAAAEAMMNFVYDPEVQATIAAYVNYTTPVQGTKEVLEKDDPALAKSQLIFPDSSTLKQLHIFRKMSPEEERTLNEKFQAVVGA